MFRATPKTEFAARCVEALDDAGLDQTQAAALLTEMVGRTIKPQTVQAMTSKAKMSALTADLAAVTGWRYPYLAYGKLPRKDVDLATASNAFSGIQETQVDYSLGKNGKHTPGWVEQKRHGAKPLSAAQQRVWQCVLMHLDRLPDGPAEGLHQLLLYFGNHEPAIAIGATPNVKSKNTRTDANKP